MAAKFSGPGLYEFLVEAELQQYYNPFRNELKVQNVAQLKYVSEDDLDQIGMARPEIRRLTKYFHKHCPQTYLGKMKKKLLSRKDDSMQPSPFGVDSQGLPNRAIRSVAPGRHIIQAESILIHKTLGSGEFGTVQQGVWTSDEGERIQVAIKSLSQERMQNNPVEFLKEAAIMHTANHEHIVRLYGVVLDTSALMLVTELAPLRSLLECLKETSMRKNMSVPTLFDFAIQICDGMQYLESKRLIHRDLAARNILVFSRSQVKISDFGLSRALGVGKDYYQTNFNVNLKLPIAWCAPECINFLRFTSASDVWAFSVTLWEMFSYGFQPWAALTGQQILEAIDEPNLQRLEMPECCPFEIYHQIMTKCWQHDAVNRPTFAQLSQILPECKPEQVQTLREAEVRSRRDLLVYEAGEVITVLDKKPVQGSDDGVTLWKGVLNCGKSGLFNPANTITYLGSSLPSLNQRNQSPFHRNDSRSSSMRKGRILSADMISEPQGDLKHTGHMGSDGEFFGDITFLTSKCWVPRQVVSPYKPEEFSKDNSSQGCQLPSAGRKSLGDSNSEIHSSDTVPLLCGGSRQSDEHSQRRKPKRRQMLAPINVINPVDNDHEYHEISDEENEIMGITASQMGNVGLSNPALSTRSQSPAESPRFDKSFDTELSLVDEVFGALQEDKNPPSGFQISRNEMMEYRNKKKFATVKPISSSDRRTLDQAIAIANELASRSMLDLDRPGKHPNSNNSLDDISSPRTPTTPTHRRKFSFILGSNKGNDRERRNYSQEAASIPDIQSSLTDEAKEAYNTLVEKPTTGSLGFLTPTFEGKSAAFHFPEHSRKSDFFDQEPLSPPSINSVMLPSSSTNSPQKKLPRTHMTRSMSAQDDNIEIAEDEADGNPLRLLRMNKQSNVLPLPPRERASTSFSNAVSSRHQRKHPLLIPGRIPASGNSKEPPMPPPKPLRQKPPPISGSPSSDYLEPNSLKMPFVDQASMNREEKDDRNKHPSPILKNLSAFPYASNVSHSRVPLYENYENLETATDGEINVLSSNPKEDGSGSKFKHNENDLEISPKSDFDFQEGSDKRCSEDTYQADNSGESSQSADSVLMTPMKLKSVQRIMGPTAKEVDCIWALNSTSGDSTHAVKLLRLKDMLPETMISSDVQRALSVLEMFHWDILRASDFLLKTPPEPPRSIRSRSEFVNSNRNSISSFSHSTGESNAQEREDYVRPTHV